MVGDQRVGMLHQAVIWEVHSVKCTEAVTPDQRKDDATATFHLGGHSGETIWGHRWLGWYHTSITKPATLPHHTIDASGLDTSLISISN